MVPTNRLLAWVAIIGLPFAVVGATSPAGFGAALLACGALAVVAVLDAALAYGRLREIRVELPGVVRLTKDKLEHLPIRLHAARTRPSRVQVALALPLSFDFDTTGRWMSVPPEPQRVRMDWACTPHRRGRFVMNHVSLEELSRMGLWSLRRVVPVQVELRVYPNLWQERRRLAALFLNRGFTGIHLQRQIGKGREFEQLREYIHGDSFEDIHWKATAKRGHPVTKVYQLERTQEVYVLLDASRLSARPAPRVPPKRVPKAEANTAPSPAEEDSAGVPESDGRVAEETALERFITAALLLARAAERQGDLYGVVTFHDRVQSFIRARRGHAHYNACREALYTLEPRLVTPDFAELTTFLRLRLRRRALLVLLTALDDPMLAESFIQRVELICRQHLVLVNMLQPPGVAPLFSQAGIQSDEELYDALAGHLRWRRLAELSRALQRRGVALNLLSQEQLSVQLISQYLAIKQRQRL